MTTARARIGPSKQREDPFRRTLDGARRGMTWRWGGRINPACMVGVLWSSADQSHSGLETGPDLILRLEHLGEPSSFISACPLTKRRAIQCQARRDFRVWCYSAIPYLDAVQSFQLEIRTQQVEVSASVELLEESPFFLARFACISVRFRRCRMRMRMQTCAMLPRQRQVVLG